MTDRIRTSHVGSLIRPSELVALMRARQRGESVSEDVYAECLEKAVRDVVRQQVETGIDIVSDGEFRKYGGWFRYVLERISGVERKIDHDRIVNAVIDGRDRRDFAEFYAQYDAALRQVATAHWEVTGPLVYDPTAINREIAELRGATSGIPAENVFMTAVAPASALPEQKNRFYKNNEDLMVGLADAMREEYKAIVDAGFLLQIDDAFLATNYEVFEPQPTIDEYRKWAAQQIEVLNYAVRGLPEERIRYHVCWGSWNGPHVHDIEAKHLVDIILKAKVGGYSLEMANPRHEHEWRVWESIKLPAGKTLLPGVISHATNVVEHPDLVAERIVRLAKLVGRENVIASTDCGFAQSPFTQRVHPSIMWAKLASLAEGARRATQQLWGNRAADSGKGRARKQAS